MTDNGGYVATHTQVKVSVDKQTAAEFKEACASAGVSMASEISRFMAGGRSRANIKPELPPVTTRRQRRKELAHLRMRMGRVLEAETRYLDNIPENLRGSTVFEAAERSVETIESLVEEMGEVF
jgi:hypothetical protein